MSHENIKAMEEVKRMAGMESQVLRNMRRAKGARDEQEQNKWGIIQPIQTTQGDQD